MTDAILPLESLEAVAQRCSVKKVLLEISQNSIQNSISKNTFSYRTPPVTASESFFCQKFDSVSGIFIMPHLPIHYKLLRARMKFFDISLLPVFYQQKLEISVL